MREPAQVAEARLEGNGQVSVIRKEQVPDGHREASNDRLDHEPDGEGQSAVGIFLRTVALLGEEVGRHQRAIDMHRQQLAAVKEVLSAHGIRWPMLHGKSQQDEAGVSPPAAPPGR